MTAVIGGRITMPCRTTLTTPVDWYYLPLDDERSRVICLAGNIISNYSNRITLDRSALSDFSLTIHNVTREDEGVYVCREDAGLEMEHRNYLNIQGKTNIPKCPKYFL